jgi:hypothetical protein
VFFAEFDSSSDDVNRLRWSNSTISPSSISSSEEEYKLLKMLLFFGGFAIDWFFVFGLVTDS